MFLFSTKQLTTRCIVKNRQAGISLVELMIALALGAMLLLGVFKVFDLHQRGFQLIVDLNDREDNAQLALKILTDAIRMADHWGGVETSKLSVLKGSLSSAPGACDIHWVLDVTQGIKGMDGESAASQIKGLPNQCIKDKDYIEHSDMLAVRFADGRHYFYEQELDNKRYQGHYFVRTQAGDAALIFQGRDTKTAINTIPDKGYHYNMAFYSSLFFLKPCQLNSVACIETESVLTRLVLSGDRYRQEPLVEGIEQLQFEYGVDEDADSVVDRYLPAEDVSDWQHVMSVRLFLLARSRLRDISKDEMGEIYLMNSEASPTKAHYKVTQDGRYYRRKLYQRDVELKNRS